MFDFSLLLAMPAVLDVSLYQPSSIQEETAEVWNHLPGCPSVDWGQLSGCYDVNQLAARHENQGIIITLLENSKSEEVKLKEGEETAFNVRLKSQPTDQVKVVSQVKGGEKSIKLSSSFPQHSDSTLTFDSGNWNKDQKIYVISEDDKVDKENQKVIIKLIPSGGGYDQSDSEEVVLTIIDDDTRGLSLELSANKLSLLGNIRENEEVSFELRSKNELKDDQQVSVSILPDKESKNLLDIDYLSKSDEDLIFNSENWSTNKIITIKLKNKTDYSKDEFIDFILFLSIKEENNKNEMLVTLNIDYNNPLQSQFNLKPQLDLKEGDSTSFEIKLNTEPSSRVYVEVFNQEKIIDLNTSSITFDSKNWNTYRPITLLSKDNDNDDNDKQVDIFLYSQGENYNNRLKLMSINLMDDDLPSVVLLLPLAIVTVVGLKGIPSILKYINNISGEFNNIIQMSSEINKLLHENYEKQNQKNLEAKIDKGFRDIDNRLRKIENKI